MIPILYEANETAFTSNGLGGLADALECIVREEMNGPYELTMRYPVGGIHYDDITLQRIICASPAENKANQPFRIYRITRPINGKVTVYAQHLSYDLNGIAVEAFTETGASRALSALVTHALDDCPFTTWCNITNDNSEYSQDVPASFRSRLGGVRGSILDVFGGEYEFDGYTVKLWANRGTDNGVRIEYGKNLQTLTDDENSAKVYTGVLCYYSDDNGTVSGDIQHITNYQNYLVQNTLVLDVTSDFEDVPSESDLNARALAYIEANDVGTPKVNLKFSFVPLWQTEEYKDIAPLEHVNLCDTVHVYYTELGVEASAKVVATEWNVLSEKYDEVEIGAASSSLAETITQGITEDMDEIIEPAVSYFEQQLEQATAVFQLGEGSHLYFGTNADGQWNEIYFLDTESIDTATYVLRINGSGIGFSTTGYYGTFNSAWTIDGTLNMANINVVNLVADLIQGGTLRMGGLNNIDGVIEVYDDESNVIARVDVDGIHVYGTETTVTMNAEDGFCAYNSNNEKIYYMDETGVHIRGLFAEEEMTIVSKMRFIPITNGSNDGMGLVATMDEEAEG